MTRACAQGTKPDVVQSGRDRGLQVETAGRAGRSSRARWLAALVAAGLALGAVACGGGGGEEKPAETSGASAQDEAKATRLLEKAREEHSEERLRMIIARFGHTQAAESAKADLGVILAGQADEALKSGDLDKAEEKALEAKVYGDLDTTRKAQEVLDQVDDQRADLVSKDASSIAENGKCASALKRVANTLGKKARGRYKKKVQAQSRDAIVKCLAEKIEDEVEAANIDGARSLLEQSEVKVALDKEGQSAAEKALAKSIVKRSLSTVQPMLERHEWQPAIDEVDKLQASKTLDAQEYEAAFSIVQDAILAYLIQRSTEALNAKNPGEIWTEIEATEKLARWKRTPDELSDLYTYLSMAIECENLGCKRGKPKLKYSWGKIDLKPPADAKGGTVASTKHAQKLWVIADGKDLSLIATKDPGSATGAEFWQLAAGWADEKQVKSQDTELWLPPQDQLLGTRIWGPLRPPKKDYHLGVVKEVVGGKNVVVKRLSDDEDVTVELKDIRVGTLKNGLRVMAFCVDQIQPEKAKIDKVVTTVGGIPKVKVICDTEKKERVEVASALITQKAWLPPKKP
ncbi:MAG: hypothetical protein KC766_35220 [Myxococcales bacterium]|nr:hypothetical protein [Myxococcales bacterium]